MVIGFGAALVVANATYAQEVDNTVWDEPNVTAITQAAPVQAQPTHDLSNAGDSSALNLEAMNTTSIVPAKLQSHNGSRPQDWMVVSLLLTIVLVGLYSFVSAKRTNQI